MKIPVALFSYNRFSTLKKTLECLKRNYLADQTDIFIFSDGPKDLEDYSSILEIRNYIKKIEGFKKIILIEREINLGLSKNIISGIDHVLEKNNSVIVLEDDILTSKYFLKFMNDALTTYENFDNVCQVSGYSYLEKYSKKYELDETYFIKGGDCMAWGTWKTSWDLFTEDAQNLYDQIKQKKLDKSFNRNNSYNYLKMLKARASEKNQSWAICWYAINFLKNKYTFYPLRTFAKHIGNDKNATNYIPSNKDGLNVNLNDKKLKVSKISVLEKLNTKLAYEEFLKDLRGNYFERLKCYLKVFKRENI